MIGDKTDKRRKVNKINKVDLKQDILCNVKGNGKSDYLDDSLTDDLKEVVEVMKKQKENEQKRKEEEQRKNKLNKNNAILFISVCKGDNIIKKNRYIPTPISCYDIQTIREGLASKYGCHYEDVIVENIMYLDYV